MLAGINTHNELLRAILAKRPRRRGRNVPASESSSDHDPTGMEVDVDGELPVPARMHRRDAPIRRSLRSVTLSVRLLLDNPRHHTHFLASASLQKILSSPL